MATSTRTWDKSRPSMEAGRQPVSAEFSIGQARAIVRDLFIPNRAIYWTDFLVSMFVGAFFFGAVHRQVFIQWLTAQAGGNPVVGWSLTAAFFLISCLAFYRAALFTHELVHLRPGAVPGLFPVWNTICGVPFLMPSFLYNTHIYHHVRKHYGTDEDGEYLPLATGGRIQILLFLGQSFVIPVLAAVRFLVFTPLAWCSPKFKRFIQRRASSMVVDPSYVRPLPTKKEIRIWKRQERGAFAYCVLITALLATGVLPIYWLLQAYLTGVTIIFINAVRTLGAHRYRLRGESTFSEQLADSLNYPNSPLLSEIWAPVGLRYHALHHLFPSMPYHNLAEAHRRLMAELPADSVYRQTECPGLWHSILQLWQDAKESEQARRFA